MKVFENQIIQVGNLTGGVWDKRFRIATAVFDEQGICPTITCFGGGGTETKILVRADEETDTLQTE